MSLDLVTSRNARLPGMLYMPESSADEVCAFLRNESADVALVAERVAASSAPPSELRPQASAIAFRLLTLQECANLNADVFAQEADALRDALRPDEAMYFLSKIYAHLREGGKKKAPAGSSTAGAGDSFDRRSMKFLVHPQDWMWVVLSVLPHLSLYSFKDTHALCQSKGIPYSVGNKITSVYYDNEANDCYRHRQMRIEGAYLVRFRWYIDADAEATASPSDGQAVFAERKTHHESAFGTMRSVKERFALKSNDVAKFVKGDAELRNTMSKQMKAKGASKQKIAAAVALYDGIQNKVLADQLVPCVRTSYTRAAFQNGADDASFRVSIDANLCMTVEHAEACKATGWHDPTSKPDGTHRHTVLPYMVAEVKIEGAAEELPEWVSALLVSPFMLPVPKFSKFGHGVRSLVLGDNPHMLPEPYWYGQMGPSLDIRSVLKTIPQHVQDSLLPPDEDVARSDYARLRKQHLGKEADDTAGSGCKPATLLARHHAHAPNKNTGRLISTPDDIAAEVLGDGLEGSGNSRQAEFGSMWGASRSVCGATMAHLGDSGQRSDSRDDDNDGYMSSASSSAAGSDLSMGSDI
eukprot:PhM_4_TR14719/c0_g1_i1/m.62998